MANENLRQAWKNLIDASSIPEAVRDRWFEKICAAYSEPGRSYHTLTHIFQLFDLLERYKQRIRDATAVGYAIFFHDIVYDPHSKLNEEKSVETFRGFASEAGLDNAEEIVRLIEATASHLTDAHLGASTPGSDDLHYFLDFDMAILGSSPAEYDQYKEQIRQEYIHLEEATYKQERAKVLKMFLQIPNIFATEEFRKEYEAKARENIQREIKELTS